MSFFFRIFSRQKGKALGSSEDWQRGDQAECVTRQWWLNGQIPVDGPQVGQVKRVSDVKAIAPPGLPPILFLSFDGHSEWFSASGFRKVRPRADEAIAAEAEFVELVRRTPAPALPRETIEEFQ